MDFGSVDWKMVVGMLGGGGIMAEGARAAFKNIGSKQRGMVQLSIAEGRLREDILERLNKVEYRLDECMEDHEAARKENQECLNRQHMIVSYVHTLRGILLGKGMDAPPFPHEIFLATTTTTTTVTATPENPIHD